jgi:hypothetical protein
MRERGREGGSDVSGEVPALARTKETYIYVVSAQRAPGHSKN